MCSCRLRDECIDGAQERFLVAFGEGIDGLQAPRGVIFAGDNKTAFVTLAGGPSVGVVDLASRKLMRTIGVGQSPDGVGYGPTP